MTNISGTIILSEEDYNHSFAELKKLDGRSPNILDFNFGVKEAIRAKNIIFVNDVGDIIFFKVKNRQQIREALKTMGV